jgi:hypothetical protein
MHLQYNDAFFGMPGIRVCVEALHEDNRILQPEEHAI